MQRGLRESVLVRLLALESAGVRCCNPIAATLAVSDRLTVVQQLAAAGIAVPASRPSECWADAREAASAGAVVVKSRNGHAGRGTGIAIVLDGRLPPAPAFPGPWLLQEFVPGDGRVRKLYVVGNHVRALLKPASTPGRHDLAPFRYSARLADLAIRAGAALRLDIYGVDVIVGPDGPLVIDVNPFPGFRGISHGAALVACHVHRLARGPDHPGDCP